MNTAPERAGSLFFLTSDSLNTLPSPATSIRLFMDANVLSRLDSANTDNYEKLRCWLALNKRHECRSVVTSFVLEHIISHNKPLIARAPAEMRKRFALVLGGEGYQMTIKGKGTVADVICNLASDALVSCAEIAWVRRHRLKKRDLKREAFEAIKQFLEWRRREFPDVSHTISTMLCLATIAGNDIAASALKALKQDPELICNGAFDAVHLGHFARACQPDGSVTDGEGPLSVFVTGDKGLAKAITTFKSGWMGNRGVTFFESRLPWLGANIAEQVRKDFVGWTETTEHQPFSVDARALMQVLKLCGQVPKSVQVLFCRTQELRRRLKALNRKMKVDMRRPPPILRRPAFLFPQGVSILPIAMENRIRMWASRTAIPRERGSSACMTPIAELCVHVFCRQHHVRPF